ncbi:MAG: DUF2157 domain-containing protein [Gammaproteobacteria bacterium]|nr:DUF2157 domain-containing protein [Gammaproteobacteria bacterium]
MSNSWQSALARWTAAGIVDAAAAGRIRAWEAENGGDAGRGRLALIAFGLGGLLLIAGVLLFVAAHWDDLSPAGRFALVLAMIAVAHLGGAFAAKSSAGLSATLHAVGTGALGAGIFLAGQIFNMAEHWPGALMLWSMGAAAGVLLLRQWPQVLWLALLAPAWLWGEWIEALPPDVFRRGATPVAVGVLLLACSYLSALRPDANAGWRRALNWLGAVALVPAAVMLASTGFDDWPGDGKSLEKLGTGTLVVGWGLAIALPFAVACALRGREAVYLLIVLAWALVVTQVNARQNAGELALHALFAAGAVGIVLWGVKDRQRLAVNVGVLGFALAVLFFYFSSIFDKLGRSLGLIGIGVIFIGGGWLLERMRRKLVGRIGRSGP